MPSSPKRHAASNISALALEQRERPQVVALEPQQIERAGNRLIVIAAATRPFVTRP
jgi:hypothetical protein